MNETLQAILSNTQEGRGSLIPLLQQIQGQFGYIPADAIDAIADKADVSPSEVFGVLTFYAQFRLTPQGRNVIRVCRGTACHVRGGVAVRKALERILGIQDGETTPDMEYSLETVACIGACGLAPTIVVNEHVHGQMTTKKVEEMFQAYSGGKDD